jgi:DNA-binding LacI/PurR family transcriptional regulator
VTITDIAKKASVHRSTVSLALRGDPRISEATRSRIQAAARQLGYLPNLMARALDNRRTKTVGLLIPKLRDDFYLSVLAHQEE